MKKRLYAAMVFWLALLSVLRLFGQTRTYTANSVNPHPPVIDGVGDDPVWQAAELAGDFVQYEPNNGKEPCQKTDFKIVFDPKNLYVLIRAHDTSPDSIVKRMSRRDDLDGDFAGIAIDSYHDHRTCFIFWVSCGGVLSDEIISNNGDNEDSSWDPVWQAKTSADVGGWTAEMRIPMGQLRFGKSENSEWGLEVVRQVFRKQEMSFWQFIAKDSPGIVHAFGHLNGLKGIVPSRRMEWMPYTVGKVETMRKEEGNPFLPGHTQAGSLGLDGKIGVTSDLTLDLTINPDFGQVEADPSVVNLSAFETFYEEKRPFFIEGKNILSYSIMLGDGDMSNDNLFYTRRIGRFPQYEIDVADTESVKMPGNTSILGAMKLSGKTKNGFSIGVMDAVTAEEDALIDNCFSRREAAVEPMTNYFLGRVQKDFREGATTVGGIVTHTYRDIRDGQLDFLTRHAVTAGFDLNHQWKDRTYYVIFKSVFSNIHGSEEALLDAQTASVRYFQRPDADWMNLDSSRTSLAGYGGSLFIGKSGNGHVNAAAGATWRSPGLELNDMGYMRQADYIMQFVSVGLRWWDPFSIFKSVNVNFNQYSGFNFGRENVFNGGNVNAHATFKNYWSAGGGIGMETEGLSATALRGGPALLYPAGVNQWYHLETDDRKKWRITLSGSNYWALAGGSHFHNLESGMTFRPNNAVSLSVNPFVNINFDDFQYIDTIGWESDRFVFGRIDQKTVGLFLRLNWYLSPNLSIQFYGQPFVSAGKYSRLKYVTEPRAEAYVDRFHQYTDSEISYNAEDEVYRMDETGDGTADYEIVYPDFNFREFRSNLVIRWEYMPGSTLYLVWSQGRSDAVSDGRFAFGRDMNNLFHVYPHDVFLVKISKWLSW